MDAKAYPKDDYQSLVNFSLSNTSKSAITFQLFSSGEEIGFVDDQTIKNATYKRDLPSKFFIHGYLNSSEKSPYYKTLRGAYEEKGCHNIIYVDWSKASSDLYSVSAANSKIIGEHFADFIIAGFELNKVHLIGHSLGSHMTGFAGKSVFTKTGKKIARITALDPAGPKFEGAPADNRLDKNDALMVDVIHTDDHHYGYSLNLGRVDFYPNGGLNQPGCPSIRIDDNCSHARSILYYIESLKTHVGVYSSASWEDYLNEKLDHNNKATFGDNLDMSAIGTFYFKTRSVPPFLK